MQFKAIRYAAGIAVILALLVVMLGAYTRLTNAGLGCPDWPGCYGHMVLPSAANELSVAQTQFPFSPIETKKAWTEMAHRYAAGTLALLILFIAVNTLWLYWQGVKISWRLPVILLILVLLQAVLGMWTVTWKLLPVVVMSHLLGGILIFACLCCFRLQKSKLVFVALPQWRVWIGLGACIVLMQIALGGWVSSNYAGIACVGFPQCNGQWLPPLHLSQGFNLFSAPVGTNYQGGVLDNDVRITIQYIHRLGAFVTAFYILGLMSFLLARISDKIPRRLALLAILLICIQFVLGIVNVVYLLPLDAAVAHNGIAALLLATLFMLFYFTRGRKPHYAD